MHSVDYVRLSEYNAGIDAMSTWLEGQVQELIEQLKRVNHHTVSDEIWRLEELKRKLTGEGK